MREAAGFIVFTDSAGTRRFLLLRNARHRTWGFPKGHLDPGESARAAARRELLEETGIDHLEEDPDWSAESVYHVRDPGQEEVDVADLPEKRVRYFLGRAPTSAWTRSPEHDAGDWVLAEEAVALLEHDDLRRVFRESLRRLARRT